jgi:hypothetical protein
MGVRVDRVKTEDVQVERGSEDLAAGRSRMAVTRVERWGTRMEYATRERFGGLGLKTISGWFTSLGLKTRAKVPRRNGWHVAASGSSCRGKLLMRRHGGRRMKMTLGWAITPLD